MSVLVIHTVGSLGENAGGPTRTVPSLCRHVASAGVDVVSEIVTTTDRKFGNNLAPDGVKVHTSDIADGSRGLVELIGSRIEPFEPTTTLIHDHGQWLPMNRASAAMARKFGVKRIVTPRGMLSPWALGHHRFKKSVAWWLFAKRDLHQASMVHATSEQEHDDLRRLGVTVPILVCPNGVDFPSEGELGNSSKNLDEPPFVLFLGRLHQIKGIHELIAAWQKVQPEGWELRLAGPDEENLLDRISIGTSDRIRYLGKVEGDKKWALLRDASLLVLPSFTENFGVAAAEALVAGTPVIATKGTPWQSLKQHDCGWWIEMNKLAETLRDATSLDPTRLHELGQKGRKFAQNAFGWNKIGGQTADAYRWLLGFAEQPECVRLK